MRTNCITVKNITKSYETFSVTVPEMEIPLGGKVVLLGEEGSGSLLF